MTRLGNQQMGAQMMVAKKFQKEWQNTISTASYTKLSDITLELRKRKRGRKTKGTRPLWGLGGRIIIKRIGKKMTFIGIPRRDKRHVIAAHAAEHGLNVRISPKFRKYLVYLGFYLRADTKFFKIPRRPHFGPTMKKMAKEIEKLYAYNVAYAIDMIARGKGAWGGF